MRDRIAQVAESTEALVYANINIERMRSLACASFGIAYTSMRFVDDMSWRMRVTIVTIVYVCVFVCMRARA